MIIILNSNGREKQVIPSKRIDKIDAKILKDLLIDGRKQFIEIAREAHVSKDIIWQHYAKMKKNGIIIGATIQLHYASLGYNISASFFIDVLPKEQRQVIEQLRKIPGIYDAYRWGSHSRLWAVSDMMRIEQIEPIKRLILELPSVLSLEVEIWTGNRNTPENLSVLTNNKISSAMEKTETLTRNKIKKDESRIDAIDRQLIEKLSANSRASFNAIGKELGISTSTAIRRYNNLKCNHIIRPIIQINPTKIGYPISACFRLIVNTQGNMDIIAKKINEIPDVIGLHKTTGIYDLTIFTEIMNFEHLITLENKIAKIDGIRTMDPVSLNQFPVLPYPREHISTF
jgi:Lrp/AsnC family transcriptional regulator for asnA, asnC and gidA